MLRAISGWPTAASHRIRYGGNSFHVDVGPLPNSVSYFEVSVVLST
jgi:hypothetical protein